MRTHGDVSSVRTQGPSISSQALTFNEFVDTEKDFQPYVNSNETTESQLKKQS